MNWDEQETRGYRMPQSRFFDKEHYKYECNGRNRQKIPEDEMIRMCSFFLFVFARKVLCDVNSLVGGYHYPQPHPPVQLDEVTAPSGIYLPPVYQPPIYHPPIYQDDVFAPELPPIPEATYLPAIYPPLTTPPDIFSDEDTVVVSPPPPPVSLYQAPPSQMKIINMSCIQDGSFKSTFRLEGRSFQSPPVIDEGANGCITTSSNGVYSIEMRGSRRMSDCGVRRCSTGSSTRANMCVVVRMPTVQGLKLPEDMVVTLQCIPQDTVVSHTKQIRLAPTSAQKGRSSSNAIIASGGGKQKFNSHMVLLRKSPGSNNFDQPLQSGNTVLLGEEIVLRATVSDGDGWKFSRMGPVIIKSSNSQRALTLVEENGCRSAGIRTICPFQPRQLTSLDNMLHFRAFLFQESSKGDDMVLSVRMLGCLNPQDCFRNGICDDVHLPPPTRIRRSAETNDTTNWESQFQFRVQMPQEEDNNSVKSRNHMLFFSNGFFLIAIILGIVVIVGLVLSLIYCRKRKDHLIR
ncbi:hypothetical protein JTB14_026583 [Gonioctena quinquepunctata]|nr:hypothetical protein JTB14_026583 [Gonioctena quinquepunctata]